MHGSPLGTEPLAAFLAAVKVINESPEQMITRANFSARVVVEPYVSTSIRLDDEYQVQGQRDVAKMAARRECFHGDSDGGGADLNASNESYPEDLLGGGEGLDVHAFISGGDTEVVARFAPIVEAAGKSIVGYAAQGDMLSDKTRWPTFNRVISNTNYEAMAFARVVAELGWSRVGVVYIANRYGREMRMQFETACRKLSVTVAAAVPIPPILDHLELSDRNRSMYETAARIRRSFLAANVKVYLLAAHYGDGPDVLFPMLQSRMVGPGYTVLTPTQLTLPVSAAVGASKMSDEWTDLVRLAAPLLSGSLGLQPYYITDSVAATQMENAWPTTQAKWDALIATSPQRVQLSDAEMPSARTIWSAHVWDATFLMCRAISKALSLCPSDRGVLNTKCVVSLLRNETVRGATGDVQLDENGDRLSSFVVTNIANGVSLATGHVKFNGPDVNESVATIDVGSIVWSDRVSNRTSGPQWGQEEVVPSAPPHAGTVHSSAIYTFTGPHSIIVIAPAVVVLTIACVLLWRADRNRRRKRVPADFAGVLERLNKLGKLGGLGTLAAQPSSTVAATITVDSELGIPPELRRTDIIMADVIGKGEFGVVSKGMWATHAGRSRVLVPVAVKTALGDHFVSEMGLQLAFLEEAAVTWQFDHDNVVHMYGVVTSGFPYLLVLELCENGSLINYVKNAEHPPSHLLNIIHGVASGMAHLASKHFVHRDLAARNVVLSSDSTPKISDFGLGRCLEGDDYYRLSTDTALLPLRWTDPAAAETLVFTEATDVWAFGVTAWEVFSRGARPYSEISNLLFFERVKDGHRLNIPATMPHNVYTDAVLPCWAGTTNGDGFLQIDKTQRPTFAALKMTIAGLIAQQNAPAVVELAHTNGVRRSASRSPPSMAQRPCDDSVCYILPSTARVQLEDVQMRKGSATDSGIISQSSLSGSIQSSSEADFSPYSIQPIVTSSSAESYISSKVNAAAGSLPTHVPRHPNGRAQCQRETTI
eukprot:m.54082 g.54082  ORF g.54082 m.54082 type:complete len:992 (-) comp16738_c0_seq4:2478-5453(-)